MNKLCGCGFTPPSDEMETQTELDERISAYLDGKFKFSSFGAFEKFKAIQNLRDLGTDFGKKKSQYCVI